MDHKFSMLSSASLMWLLCFACKKAPPHIMAQLTKCKLRDSPLNCGYHQEGKNMQEIFGLIFRFQYQGRTSLHHKKSKTKRQTCPIWCRSCRIWSAHVASRIGHTILQIQHNALGHGCHLM